MKRLVLTLIFLLTMSIYNVYGATYYISPTGNDSSGNGSIGSPWKSLSKADGYLNPGDILYCRGGIYTDTSDYFQSATNGSSGSGITIKNYIGEIPIFRALGQVTNDGNVIFKIDHDYYVIDGIEIRPTDTSTFLHNGIRINGDYNEVKNCYIMGTTLSDGRYSFSSALRMQGNYNEVHDCTMDRAGDPTNSQGQLGYLLHIYDGHYNKVYNNTLSRGVHDVISCYTGSSYNEIYDNIITHAIGYGVYFRFDSDRNLAEGNNITGCDEIISYVKNPIYIQGEYNIVRNNVGWNNEVYGLAMHRGDYNKVYNNVFYNNGSDGFWAQYDTSPEHNRIVNNVIAHNMVTGDWSRYYAEMADVVSNSFFAPSHDNQVKNNFIVAYVSGVWKDDYYRNVHIVSGGGQKRSVSYMEANYSTWSNNIYNYSDPKFTDPGTGDFSIQAGSSLIDAGTTLAVANGTGSNSTNLVVDDAGWFWKGDEIMIGGSTTRTISAINYSTNTLILDSAASWNNGDSVSLSYNGVAPDIGAYEYDGGSKPKPAAVSLRLVP